SAARSPADGARLAEGENDQRRPETAPGPRRQAAWPARPLRDRNRYARENRGWGAQALQPYSASKRNTPSPLPTRSFAGISPASPASGPSPAGASPSGKAPVF